jgi:hypothetical protein
MAKKLNSSQVVPKKVGASKSSKNFAIKKKLKNCLEK